MLAYTEVRLSQYLNADAPIVCRPSGKDTDKGDKTKRIKVE